MKNAYQRRRVKARVEKRARMMKLDAITLDFARQVIEEETARRSRSRSRCNPRAPTLRRRAQARGSRRQEEPADLDLRLDRRCRAADPSRAGRFHAEPDTGADRGAGARARRGTIDLALVEDGIEIGKKMMAEMIANYPSRIARRANSRR
jgi:hypothetical protein